MNKAFTIYWKANGGKEIGEGNPILSAGGSNFWGKIDVGSRVFVTNILNGQLRLLGAFSVDKVMRKAIEGKPLSATWEAEEYLVAREGTSAPFRARQLPTELVGALRFKTASGVLGKVKLKSNGSVDGQTMRPPRELTPESAALLESKITERADTDWTEAELKAAVDAYLEISRLSRAGMPVVKKRYYQELAARYNRSEGAFEYRMLNISYVLAEMGRDWVRGLAPAANVGVNIAAQIERLINSAEGRVDKLRVADAVAVTTARSRLRTAPGGNRSPTTVKTTTTDYVRDADVKAWVLDRAKGLCEACLAPAPFTKVDGYPFLEVHHVRKLADGGSDCITNAVAICPNCHRRLHYSADAPAFRDSLFGIVSELIRE